MIELYKNYKKRIMQIQFCQKNICQKLLYVIKLFQKSPLQRPIAKTTTSHPIFRLI